MSTGRPMPRPGDMGAEGYTIWTGGVNGAPQDGDVYFSRAMPPGANTGTVQGMEPGEAFGGRWTYIGNPVADYGMGDAGGTQGGANQTGGWQFVKDQAPVAAGPAEEMPQEKPKERFPEGDIYNDWDYFQKRARADVEGINRMPFTYSDFPNIEKDPKDAMNQFYPGAWQEGGVQKIIGPNGTNIAPGLDPNMLKLFRDGGIDTAAAKDWPSLVESLLQQKRIDPGMSQVLLDLAKPKELDTSFQSSSLMGMM